MTMPDDKSKKSPVDRFHKILSSVPSEVPKDEQPKSEVINRLPKATKTANVSTTPPPAPHSPDASGGSHLKRERYLRTFWTVASALSLVVNIVLLLVLAALLIGGNLADLGKGLLGGLYSNFERMDQAHIKTEIPVNTTIPLNLSIPVQTTTGITLANDVAIKGAHVKISTALFNIDAPADVTLPAGTSLNVNLDFTVPVKTEVPVSMKVLVDIPLQNTDLHPAITGLENTIKPLYCMISPFAKSLNGSAVCP
jgi:hypothetical protein